jgi:small-conductance mechanosensitive channel
VASSAVAVAPLDDVGLWARTNLLESLLIIVGAVLLARFAGTIGDAVTRQIDARSQLADALVRSEATKHRHAVSEILTWVTRAVIYCVALITVLGRLGLPLGGIVAPAAVAGVALGFGAQPIVQDILAGFFLITERQYGFGDLVQLSVTGVALPRSGTVEDVTLRITSIRTTDGSVIITPNGQIVQVTNLSRDWARAVVDVPIPIGSDVALANDVLRRVGAEAFADSDLKALLLDAPSVLGGESLDVGPARGRANLCGGPVGCSIRLIALVSTRDGYLARAYRADSRTPIGKLYERFVLGLTRGPVQGFRGSSGPIQRGHAGCGVSLNRAFRTRALLRTAHGGPKRRGF